MGCSVLCQLQEEEGDPADLGSPALPLTENLQSRAEFGLSFRSNMGWVIHPHPFKHCEPSAELLGSAPAHARHLRGCPRQSRQQVQGGMWLQNGPPACPHRPAVRSLLPSPPQDACTPSPLKTLTLVVTPPHKRQTSPCLPRTPVLTVHLRLPLRVPGRAVGTPVLSLKPQAL